MTRQWQDVYWTDVEIGEGDNRAKIGVCTDQPFLDEYPQMKEAKINDVVTLHNVGVQITM